MNEEPRTPVEQVLAIMNDEEPREPNLLDKASNVFMWAYLVAVCVFLGIALVSLVRL